jgi:hypothetical protein
MPGPVFCCAVAGNAALKLAIKARVHTADEPVLLISTLFRLHAWFSSYWWKFYVLQSYRQMLDLQKLMLKLNRRLPRPVYDRACRD